MPPTIPHPESARHVDGLATRQECGDLGARFPHNSGAPMTELLDRLQLALAERYRFDREIGAGGMATVYLAHDVRHDRRVALKVLRPELAARDRRRAVPAPRSRSPPTCSTRTSCRCSTRARRTAFLFYVMPYVEGESLRDRLRREKQLPVDEAVRIACEVAVGARLRAPARRDPPRHQAREHPAARRAARWWRTSASRWPRARQAARA